MVNKICKIISKSKSGSRWLPLFDLKFWKHFYKCFSILEIIDDFGISPTSLSTATPSLKTKRLGKPLIEYSLAAFKFSSVLIFTTFIFSPSSEETSSRTGPIFRQGPHQGAQKSTTTGVFDDKTSASNDESVISNAFDIIFSSLSDFYKLIITQNFNLLYQYFSIYAI